MLREKITAELKKSLKAQDKERVAAIRLIISSLKSKDIDARGGKPVTDTDILSLLQNMIKQRRESIDMYVKGNRPELADGEKKEIEIIKFFLPEPLNVEEANRAIEQAINNVTATSLKDMGRVMNCLKEQFAGRLDFSTIAPKIKEKLGN